MNARIVDLIALEGADAWFTRPAGDFLGNLDPARYEKIDDILDVWFDSGSTHAFTLEGREHTRWPADLYLEGSDQHRGWFQSSLLEACGTRGRAPFEAILTHGFTQDEKGEKMSKSVGNTVEPQTVIKQSGAEILRLWAALSDYAEDQRIGPTVLQTTADAYRKLRNTIRYLLGALDGFADAERVAVEDMPPLERFILHRLWELDGAGPRRLRALRLRRRGSPARRLLLQRPLGAVLRHPAGRALLRPADLAPPSRLPHGDGRGVRAADDLARAPDPLHHGGGVDGALPRRRPQQPARHAGHPGGLAQRRRGGTLAAGRSGDPRGHRRAGSGAA